MVGAVGLLAVQRIVVAAAVVAAHPTVTKHGKAAESRTEDVLKSLVSTGHHGRCGLSLRDKRLSLAMRNGDATR
jgi:hypothetical protein